jgi:hypothetical protein
MDTAIARFITDTTMKNISLMIHYNNSDIMQYINSEANKHLLAKLVTIIKDSDLQKKYEGINLLRELIQCCKDLVN